MSLNLAVSGMFVAMVIIIITAAILTAGDDDSNGDGYGP